MQDKDAIIKQLTEENKQLREHIKLLEEKIARLQKNSSNSSRPPSSDIINPKPPAKNGRKRKHGGQLGHKKHSRKPFAQEQIDKTIIHKLPDKEVHRRNLTPLNETESALQQVDLPEKLYNVIEHRVQLYVDPNGNIIKKNFNLCFSADITAYFGPTKLKNTCMETF